MTKSYNTPMLQVVCINEKDIIATSDRVASFGDATPTQLGADRFRDDWDAGY